MKDATQIPNKILDKLMAILSPSQFKVVMAICRKTYGWHKRSDNISLTQLEAMTGMSRRAVIDAKTALRGLIITAKSGPRGVLNYSLNINVDIESLVQKLHQSLVQNLHQSKELTSAKNDTPLVQNLHTQKKLTKEKKSAESDRLIPSLMLLPADGHPKKKESSAAPALPGFKETVAAYHDLFLAKFGVKPDIDGRDTKLLAGLVQTHGAGQVQTLLRFFFEHPPDWVERKGKFTVYTFKGVYTELLAQSCNSKSQMIAF